MSDPTSGGGSEARVPWARNLSQERKRDRERRAGGAWGSVGGCEGIGILSVRSWLGWVGEGDKYAA